MFIIASGRADVFEVMGDVVEIKMDELDLGSVQGQPGGIMAILTGLSQKTIIRAAVEIAPGKSVVIHYIPYSNAAPLLWKISPKVF
jgi:hypothetical protein